MKIVRHIHLFINKFSKFPLRIPWPFLLGCNLSRKRSNLLFMFLCTIKAKFRGVHFSSNSSLTFFPFSNSRSPWGIKDSIDTYVPLFPCNGWSYIVFHILCCCARKQCYNTEIFFKGLVSTATRYISSNRVTNYNNSFLFSFFP